MQAAVPDEFVCALLVGEYSQDRLLVWNVFRARGWRLFEASGRRQAIDFLQSTKIAVVIADTEIPDWNWKRILNDLRSLPVPPQLIVTSRTADDYLWAEVLNCGGHDVLQRPFDPEEVERVVAAARRHFDPKPVGAAVRSASLSADAA